MGKVFLVFDWIMLNGWFCSGKTIYHTVDFQCGQVTRDFDDIERGRIWRGFSSIFLCFRVNQPCRKSTVLKCVFVCGKSECFSCFYLLLQIAFVSSYGLRAYEVLKEDNPFSCLVIEGRMFCSILNLVFYRLFTSISCQKVFS